MDYKARAMAGNPRQTTQIPAPVVPAADKPRKVMRRINHKEWVETTLMDLTSGCTFRMYEPDGSPVVDKYGRNEWVAASKPYIGADGEARIKVY